MLSLRHTLENIGAPLGYLLPLPDAEPALVRAPPPSPEGFYDELNAHMPRVGWMKRAISPWTTIAGYHRAAPATSSSFYASCASSYRSQNDSSSSSSSSSSSESSAPATPRDRHSKALVAELHVTICPPAATDRTSRHVALLEQICLEAASSTTQTATSFAQSMVTNDTKCSAGQGAACRFDLEPWVAMGFVPPGDWMRVMEDKLHQEDEQNDAPPEAAAPMRRHVPLPIDSFAANAHVGDPPLYSAATPTTAVSREPLLFAPWRPRKLQSTRQPVTTWESMFLPSGQNQPLAVEAVGRIQPEHALSSWPDFSSGALDYRSREVQEGAR